MGTVYLLGDWEKENVYKIGVTRGAIEKRIKKLQTGNAGEIYLVSYYESPHPFILEKMLHLHFHTTNIKNEWFELTVDDVINFKKICQKLQDNINALEDNYFFQRKYGKRDDSESATGTRPDW